MLFKIIFKIYLFMKSLVSLKLENLAISIYFSDFLIKPLLKNNLFDRRSLWISNYTIKIKNNNEKIIKTLEVNYY
jgi:hypothetical protein